MIKMHCKILLKTLCCFGLNGKAPLICSHDMVSHHMGCTLLQWKKRWDASSCWVLQRGHSVSVFSNVNCPLAPIPGAKVATRCVYKEMKLTRDLKKKKEKHIQILQSKRKNLSLQGIHVWFYWCNQWYPPRSTRRQSYLSQTV